MEKLYSCQQLDVEITRQALPPLFKGKISIKKEEMKGVKWYSFKRQDITQV